MKYIKLIITASAVVALAGAVSVRADGSIPKPKDRTEELVRMGRTQPPKPPKPDDPKKPKRGLFASAAGFTNIGSLRVR
jgi:hypothetical protein